MEDKDKSQTPAPKTSNESSQKVKGKRQEPAVEHLESGYDTGINPENEVLSGKPLKTSTQLQEEREKKLKDGKDSLDIPSGMEGEPTKRPD